MEPLPKSTKLNPIDPLNGDYCDINTHVFYGVVVDTQELFYALFAVLIEQKGEPMDLAIKEVKEEGKKRLLTYEAAATYFHKDPKLEEHKKRLESEGHKVGVYHAGWMDGELEGYGLTDMHTFGTEVLKNMGFENLKVDCESYWGEPHSKAFIYWDKTGIQKTMFPDHIFTIPKSRMVVTPEMDKALEDVQDKLNLEELVEPEWIVRTWFS